MLLLQFTIFDRLPDGVDHATFWETLLTPFVTERVEAMLTVVALYDCESSGGQSRAAALEGEPYYVPWGVSCWSRSAITGDKWPRPHSTHVAVVGQVLR